MWNCGTLKRRPTVSVCRSCEKINSLHSTRIELQAKEGNGVAPRHKWFFHIAALTFPGGLRRKMLIFTQVRLHHQELSTFFNDVLLGQYLVYLVPLDCTHERNKCKCTYNTLKFHWQFRSRPWSIFVYPKGHAYPRLRSTVLYDYSIKKHLTLSFRSRQVFSE